MENEKLQTNGEKPKSRLATISLILSLSPLLKVIAPGGQIGIFIFLISSILIPISFILGIIALVKINKYQLNGKNTAIAAIIFSIVSPIVAFMLTAIVYYSL